MVRAFPFHAGYWHAPSKTQRHEMLHVFFAGLTPPKNFFARRNFPDEFAADFA
jgi:hypothetical protein